MIVPLVYDASSLRSHETAPAISSGKPGRRNGMVECELVRTLRIEVELRADDARRDRVDSDVVRRKLLREPDRQRVNRGLRGGVMNVGAGAAKRRGCRRQIDDGAASVERTDAAPRAQQVPEKVHVDRVAHFRDIRVDQVADRPADCRTVHETGYRPEFVGRREEGVDRFLVRGLHLRDQGSSARCAHTIGHRLRCGSIRPETR